jgi:cytochrome c oxidase accessory protein FixG
MSSDDMEYGFSSERLATTDETGKRVYLHPEDITGFWRTLRTRFYWLLIVFYMVVPWIYIDGKQIILLDLPGREFHILGYTFYGHDGPLLIFLLLGAGFTFAFVTSIWGRVWCGWACPQTVFIDAIYRKIDLLVIGKARQRKALDKAPMSFEKFWKKSLKWFLYILVSMHIVHSGLGYFAGTHKLFWITMNSPAENWTLFTTMLVMTAIVLFDFGWFKEQFCIIACPYGRFQSVMMDDNSMVVAYDESRGEPRRNPKEIKKEDEGDCIDCKRCVKACPTGIDIRMGTQLECIACTQCIDACDEIMTKLNKPKGLIKYTSENKLKGKPSKRGIRAYVYLTFIIAIITVFTVTLNKRADLRIQFLRGSKMPYQSIVKSDGSKEIVNHFKVKLNYYGSKKYYLNLVPVDPEDAKKFNIIMPLAPIEILDANKQADVFVRFPVSALNAGHKTLKLNVIDSQDIEEDKGTIVQEVEMKLVGPFSE